jgi:hypothetical protein
MTPRATLPGAAELFRTTSPSRPAEADLTAGDGNSTTAPEPTEAHSARSTLRRRSTSGPRGDRASSGRERHEEKITVYVSAAELVDLERARLMLRAEHGIAVDRGRIVREALSVLLADLESKQDDSILVRRLGDS